MNRNYALGHRLLFPGLRGTRAGRPEHAVRLHHNISGVSAPLSRFRCPSGYRQILGTSVAHAEATGRAGSIGLLEQQVSSRARRALVRSGFAFRGAVPWVPSSPCGSPDGGYRDDGRLIAASRRASVAVARVAARSGRASGGVLQRRGGDGRSAGLQIAAGGGGHGRLRRVWRTFAEYAKVTPAGPVPHGLVHSRLCWVVCPRIALWFSPGRVAFWRGGSDLVCSRRPEMVDQAERMRP